MTANQGPTQDAVLFGVVRFEAGGSRRVRDTVITFRSAADADSFAVERGWSDYQVTPLRFFVEERSAGQGDWMMIGGKVEHLVRRHRGRVL